MRNLLAKLRRYRPRPAMLATSDDYLRALLAHKRPSSNLTPAEFIAHYESLKLR